MADVDGVPDVVWLHGGPFDGASDAQFAVSLNRFKPPYFCGHDTELVWHHYVYLPKPGAGPVEYAYAGLCSPLRHAPGCGHDHGPGTGTGAGEPYQADPGPQNPTESGQAA